MWDVSVERCVEITGPDAFELTNLITCRDLTTCDVWQCKYVLLTAADGGIVNDPVLLRLGENHFWLALADSDALLYVAGVAAGRGMDVTIREADVAPMQIQGPRSKDVIGALFGDAVARPPLLLVRRGRGRRDPRRRVAHRLDRRGRLRDLPARHVAAATTCGSAVRQAGEPFGIRAIAPSRGPADRGGHLQLRLDMRVEDTPLHVSGLEKFVELDQEQDFMGKAALARLAETGVDRKLVGIDIGGDPMTDEGALNDFWPVHAPGGERIGRVTAGAWSPRLERNVGFAWVPASHMADGTGARGGRPVAGRGRHRRRAAVRRPEQGHPQGVSEVTAARRLHRCAMRETAGA